MYEWVVGEMAYFVRELPADIAYEKGKHFQMMKYKIIKVTPVYLSVICVNGRELTFRRRDFQGVPTKEEAIQRARTNLWERVERANNELTKIHQLWNEFNYFINFGNK